VENFDRDHTTAFINNGEKRSSGTASQRKWLVNHPWLSFILLCCLVYYYLLSLQKFHFNEFYLRVGRSWLSRIDCYFQRPRAVNTPKEKIETEMKNSWGQSNGKYATVTLLFALPFCPFPGPNGIYEYLWVWQKFCETCLVSLRCLFYLNAPSAMQLYINSPQLTTPCEKFPLDSDKC